MDFENFLPNENEDFKEEPIEKIGSNQLYDVVTGRQADWQSIIYDLIHTEQLDPWDVDIVLLTKKYFEKIIKLEKQTSPLEKFKEIDYYISSKVLLAAALLLRIKSEFLINKHIKSIDEILFGKKEEKKYILEKINFNEDEIPILIPKTPIARAKKVTLSELISALNKAINTESRRIKREVAVKRAKKLSEVDIPNFKRIDLKNRIRQIYAKVLTAIKKNTRNSNFQKHRKSKFINKVNYFDLIGKQKEEKLAGFLPLLHLSNSQKIWLEQESHLGDIWIYLYEYFDKNRNNFIKDIEESLFENVEGESISEDLNSEILDNEPLKKARLKIQEKRKLAEEIAEELKQEIEKSTK